MLECVSVSIHRVHSQNAEACGGWALVIGGWHSGSLLHRPGQERMTDDGDAEARARLPPVLARAVRRRLSPPTVPCTLFTPRFRWRPWPWRVGGGLPRQCGGPAVVCRTRGRVDRGCPPTFPTHARMRTQVYSSLTHPLYWSLSPGGRVLGQRERCRGLQLGAHARHGGRRRRAVRQPRNRGCGEGGASLK
jgi:hypothetical protein